VRQLEEVLPGQISESHLGVVERGLSAEREGMREQRERRHRVILHENAGPTKTFFPINTSRAKEAKDDDQRNTTSIQFLLPLLFETGRLIYQSKMRNSPLTQLKP
jgi:hypothetical protein